MMYKKGHWKWQKKDYIVDESMDDKYPKCWKVIFLTQIDKHYSQWIPYNIQRCGTPPTALLYSSSENRGIIEMIIWIQMGRYNIRFRVILCEPQIEWIKKHCRIMHFSFSFFIWHWLLTNSQYHGCELRLLIWD